MAKKIPTIDQASWRKLRKVHIEAKKIAKLREEIAENDDSGGRYPEIRALDLLLRATQEILDCRWGGQAPTLSTALRRKKRKP